MLTIHNYIDKEEKSTNIRIGRNYCIENINKFKLNLSYETWEEIFEVTSNTMIDTIFNNFLNIYLRIFNNSFPRCNFTVKKKSKGWIMTGIITSCNRKKALYILQRKVNNYALRLYYKKYCEVLTDIIKLAKKKHYDKLISESQNKTKTAWNIIKSLTNKQKDIDNQGELELKIEGHIIKQPKILADAFNKYFTETVEESINQIKQQNLYDCNLDNNRVKNQDSYMKYLAHLPLKSIPQITWGPVNGKEVYEICKSLKWKKSAGYDEIPAWVVKQSIPFIISPLIFIINKMLTSGKFPS